MLAHTVSAFEDGVSALCLNADRRPLRIFFLFSIRDEISVNARVCHSVHRQTLDGKLWPFERTAWRQRQTVLWSYWSNTRPVAVTVGRRMNNFASNEDGKTSKIVIQHFCDFHNNFLLHIVYFHLLFEDAVSSKYFDVTLWFRFYRNTSMSPKIIWQKHQTALDELHNK